MYRLINTIEITAVYMYLMTVYSKCIHIYLIYNIVYNINEKWIEFVLNRKLIDK